MRAITGYALGRLVFGAAALAAPAATGRMLAGEGAATPDAQTLIRGMGGREVGLGLGLLLADRAGASHTPWLVAGVLADGGDVAGMTGAWRDIEPGKREPGVAFAAAAALTGLVLLATSDRR